jgi:hypothetical protein
MGVVQDMAKQAVAAAKALQAGGAQRQRSPPQAELLQLAGDVEDLQDAWWAAPPAAGVPCALASGAHLRPAASAATLPSAQPPACRHMAREDLCVKLAVVALLRPDMRAPDLQQLLGLLQGGA